VAIADDNERENHDSPIEKGTCLRIGIFFPSDGYGWDEETYSLISKNNDIVMNAGFFFDIGAYYYFRKTQTNRFGFGLNVSWLEFGWTSKTFQNEFAIAHLNVNVLKIGPQVTMRVGDKISMDLFFQARPGFFATGTGEIDNLKYASGFNVNWGTGLNIRYGILLVGVEYVFGDFKTNNTNSESLIKRNAVKLKTDNLRFGIGFKF